jgi:cell division protein FtsQ
MDGRGRLAQSLTWIAGLRARPPTPARAVVDVRDARASSALWARIWFSILRIRLPRGVGLAAAMLVIGAGALYGAIRGAHIPTIIAALEDTRDQAANMAGFRIVSVALAGNRHVSREEVLATAGITGRTSLLFLDVEAVREKLKTNPWISDASVLKLYPGELQIGIKEREAFALWQKDGRVVVIADDGTVLEPYVTPGLIRLPVVVGAGAQARAKQFLALLDRYPDLRDQVRASILIGERRWNLRLRNGLDVRLPEAELAGAFERLTALDRDNKLITRDIESVDLRLPDRVTVRLSNAAAQARAESLKEKKPPAKKGGPA